MKTFFITNRYSFLETQVNEYMQSLLVKTPEQVILYFERQIGSINCIYRKNIIIQSVWFNLSTV